MPLAAGRAKLNEGRAVDTGIETDDRVAIAKDLTVTLADTYALLLKTHVYHWNATGPLFFAVHELTERQYRDMFEAVDEIAERIRALGAPAPVNVSQLLARSVNAEDAAHHSIEDMVQSLVGDHQKMVLRLREAAISADEADDLVTADLLTTRLAFHEKAIWMLGSFSKS